MMQHKEIKIFFRSGYQDVVVIRWGEKRTYTRVTRSSLIRAMMLHDKMKGQSPDEQDSL